MKKKKNLSLIAVSFKQGFVSPNIPIVTFYQGNKQLNFILDTGSDENMIDKSALKDIKHQMIELPEEEKRFVNGVGGGQETEMCSISFGSEEDKYTENFLVADLNAPFNSISQQHCIMLHGMLGSNFLRKNNMTLDFKNLAAYSKG